MRRFFLFFSLFTLALSCVTQLEVEDDETPDAITSGGNSSGDSGIDNGEGNSGNPTDGNGNDDSSQQGDTGNQDNGGDSGDSGDTGSNGDTGNSSSVCTPGETKPCQYDFLESTIGSGKENDPRPCRTGVHTCTDKGKWGECEGQVRPVIESCKPNEIDDNCNGVVDEAPEDLDKDGFDACTGDCCETENECSKPKMVNPDAVEISQANGWNDNRLDDNCNGEVDEKTPECDEGLTLDGTDQNEHAKKLAMAMGLCPGRELVSAKLSLTGDPVEERTGCRYDDFAMEVKCENRKSLDHPYFREGGANDTVETYAVPTIFGSKINPIKGASMAVLSTGDWDNPTKKAGTMLVADGDMQTAAKIPEDWANMQPGCKAPSAPACGGTPPSGNESETCKGKEIPAVQDPIMLTLTVKVPSNATSFSFNSNFFTAEFPEMVCDFSNFNDFFTVLLDSTFKPQAGQEAFANPRDKNLAMDGDRNPVGVNLAPLKLFRICSKDKNDYKKMGFLDANSYLSDFCTMGPDLLTGTGFDNLPGNSGVAKHGATGWLMTKGNVVPGETITIRIALWEQGVINDSYQESEDNEINFVWGPDHSWDSTVLLDNFRWSPALVTPGTEVIEE